jgi:hypothetical protein
MRAFAGAQDDKWVLSIPATFWPTIMGLLYEYVGVKGNELYPYIYLYSCEKNTLLTSVYS